VSAAEPISVQPAAGYGPLAIATRVAAHLAAAAPFVVATVRSIRRGWLPVGDTAAISARSWDALTNHGVLVGQRTALSGVTDLGPLEYWLLTLPVHLDPLHGSLWGAALCCILAASLAIEAARSAFGVVGAVAASLLVLGSIAWMPSIALGPTWNPHFGDLWFLTVLASASAVFAGRRRWWPVLVLSGAVAAQAHLMFAVTSVLLVLVALVVEVFRSYRLRAGHGWLAGGIALGVACWAAPVIQEVTGHPGNLTELLGRGHGRAEGWLLGFRALGAGATPPPIWWSTGDVGSHTAITTIASRSPVGGVIALGVVVGVALWAWRSHRQELAALAAVGIVACAGLIVTFARVPVAGAFPPYLITVVFPAGALAWAAVVYAAVLAAQNARASKPTHRKAGSRRRLTALGLLPLAVLAALSFRLQSDEFQRAFDWGLVPIVHKATLQIEHDVGPGRVRVVVVGLHGTSTYGVMTGIAAQLVAKGYRPEVTGFEAPASLGPAYLVRAGSPTAHVTVRGSAVTTVVLPVR